jgi:hypothetical protein
LIGVPRLTREPELTCFLRGVPAGTRVIVKAIAGSGGKGLLALTMAADGRAEADGKQMSAADIWRHCRSYKACEGFIFQPWLEPDPTLLPIMPGRALGTVRLVSVLLRAHQPQIIYASIKLPVGNNSHDNFSGGATGNLTAGLDVATGRIGPARGPSATRTFRLEIQEKHPDTGVTIEGFQIPHWSEVLDLARKGAAAFPELRTIGWDVAISSSGIFLLEGNHHWDPEGAQISLQRGIRSDMEAFAAEVRAEDDRHGQALS